MEEPKFIPLSQGKYRGITREVTKFAIVDTEDYAFLMQWRWYCSNTGYATRDLVISRKNPRIVKKIPMHRVILECSDKDIVDHINFDSLDNRKKNLRKCDMAQNAWNRKKQIGKKKHFSSIYKGVSFHRSGKWRVEIRAKGKRISLGGYDKELDAATAYNNAALKYHGEFAILNDLSGPAFHEKLFPYTQDEEKLSAIPCAQKA